MALRDGGSRLGRSSRVWFHLSEAQHQSGQASQVRLVYLDSIGRQPGNDTLHMSLEAGNAALRAQYKCIMMTVRVHHIRFLQRA